MGADQALKHFNGLFSLRWEQVSKNWNLLSLVSEADGFIKSIWVLRGSPLDGAFTERCSGYDPIGEKLNPRF